MAFLTRLTSLTFFVALAMGAQAQTAQQPSTLLRPGLNALEPALETLQPTHWKLPQAARDEVQANLGSLHRAIESTVPPLMNNADNAPNSFAALLPLSRNVTALYDVVLRVVERARAGAPADQLAAIDQARLALDQARRSFDDSLQVTAVAQQQKLQQLQDRLAAPAPVCPAPPTKKKRN